MVVDADESLLDSTISSAARQTAVRRQFPYHVIDLELPDRLEILAVAHDRRRPG
jgi:hypothetical protein